MDRAEWLRWFVLDAQAIVDVDTTGAEALEQALDVLEQRGVAFCMSRAGKDVRALLRRYELWDRIGKDRLFATNRHAVQAFHRALGRPVPEAAGGDEALTEVEDAETWTPSSRS